MICMCLGLVLAQSPGVELPEPPYPGWKATPQRAVTPAMIFDYMDGAGELYLAYGLVELFIREYEKPGEPKITCEAYRMPTSADAFGLFSQDRTGKDLDIGQGATYASGLLVAWQGDWFIRILAERETQEAKRVITELARQVVKLCGPPGQPPGALSWLPAAGLDRRSVHYFHTHTCLNYFYFLSTENVLNLSSKTDAVMGSYSGARGRSVALVMGYPTSAEAEAGWRRFRRAYLRGLKPKGDYSTARLENGRWTAGAAKGAKVHIVLESPTRQDCVRLIEALVTTASQDPGRGGRVRVPPTPGTDSKQPLRKAEQAQ